MTLRKRHGIAALEASHPICFLVSVQHDTQLLTSQTLCCQQCYTYRSCTVSNTTSNSTMCELKATCTQGGTSHQRKQGQ